MSDTPVYSNPNPFIPLNEGFELPPLPIEQVFPVSKDYIKTIAKRDGLPIGMVAMLELGAISIANRARYAAMHNNNSDHIECPSLYLVPIARSGGRKSPAVREIFKVIRRHQGEYNKDNKALIEENRSQYRKLIKQRESYENGRIKPANGRELDADRNDIASLSKEIANYEHLRPLRLIGGNITTERLCTTLYEQHEVFALVGAEGSTVFDNIRRYKQDNIALDIYLCAYSWDSYDTGRQGSNDFSLEKPCLNIAAACQPSVVAKLLKDSDLHERGFISRLSFFKCPDTVTITAYEGAPASEGFDKIRNDFMMSQLTDDKGGIVSCDSVAAEVFSKFHEDTEKRRMHSSGDLYHLAEWAAKRVGLALRIALYTHKQNSFLKGKSPLEKEINGPEAAAAIEFVEVLTSHAKSVYFEHMGFSQIENALWLWNKLYGSSLVPTVGQIRDITRGKVAFSLDESLGLLVNNGYINIVERPNTVKGGRPPMLIIKNPKAIAYTEIRAQR